MSDLRSRIEALLAEPFDTLEIESEDGLWEDVAVVRASDLRAALAAEPPETGTAEHYTPAEVYEIGWGAGVRDAMLAHGPTDTDERAEWAVTVGEHEPNPFSDEGLVLAQNYRDKATAPLHLTPSDQDAVADLLNGDDDEPAR